MADTLAALDVIIGAQTKEFNKALGKVDKRLGKFEKGVNSVGVALGGMFAASKVFDFAKEVVNITAKFQKYEAVLTNSLGSQQEAVDAMTLIRDIAASTPFQVDGLTNSYIKLVNRGIKPTREEIIKLGDLAASQGKDFDQLVEAQLDAMTGEFERLKEFGIKASKSGDQVKFTFKGVQTQVKFTESAIKDYILSLGEVKGVSGGMAAISATLEGKLSNLDDKWDTLFLTIGQGNSGILTSTVELLSDITGGFIRLNKSINEGLEGLDAYLAAVPGLLIIKKLFEDDPIPSGATGPNPFKIEPPPGFDKKIGSDGPSITEVANKVKEGIPIFEEMNKVVADLRLETKGLSSEMGVIPEKLEGIEVAATEGGITAMQELKVAVMDAADSFQELAITSGIAFDDIIGDAKKFTVEFIRLQLAQATAAAISNAFKNSKLGPIGTAAVATAGVVAVNTLFKKFVTPVNSGSSRVPTSSTSSINRPAVGNTQQTVKVVVEGRIRGKDLDIVAAENDRRDKVITGGG